MKNIILTETQLREIINNLIISEEYTDIRRGFPHQGSKGNLMRNKSERYTLAEKICDIIKELSPNAKNFYDLFGGGAAITDVASDKKYNWNVHYNDINPMIKNMFITKNGDKRNDYELPLINNKEDFKQYIETNPEIMGIYGHPSKMNTYGYNRRDIEGNIRRFNNTYNRLKTRNNISYHNDEYNIFNLNDEDIKYCDIPYYNTQGYNNMKFDYDKFFQWAIKQKNIYISEYAIHPKYEKYFKPIPLHTKLKQGTNNIEKLFILK